MSQADIVPPTDAEKILANQALILQRLDQHAAAINGLGTNVQWIVDGCKNIFSMFSNPSFMRSLPGMMGGVLGGGIPGDDEH